MHAFSASPTQKSARSSWWRPPSLIPPRGCHHRLSTVCFRRPPAEPASSEPPLSFKHALAPFVPASTCILQLPSPRARCAMGVPILVYAAHPGRNRRGGPALLSASARTRRAFPGTVSVQCLASVARVRTIERRRDARARAAPADGVEGVCWEMKGKKTGWDGAPSTTRDTHGARCLFVSVCGVVPATSRVHSGGIPRRRASFTEPLNPAGGAHRPPAPARTHTFLNQVNRVCMCYLFCLPLSPRSN